MNRILWTTAMPVLREKTNPLHSCFSVLPSCGATRVASSCSLLTVIPPSCGCREQDGQASGGGDSDGDKWIFNTIREKDPKKCQNGSAQPEEMETNQVRRLLKRIRIIRL